MVCPFKRNKVTEIVYDFGKMVEDRKPIKEITTIKFGECEEIECPHFNCAFSSCSLRGDNYE